MKRLLQFLRTTLVGGILFLVPIVVLVIVLGKALALAHKVVAPLAKRLPVESIIGLRTPMLLAVGVMVLFCFLAGFFARTALARKIVSRLETAVLSNVPGYEFLKGMGQSALGLEQPGAYPVVLAPNPQSGSIHLLTSDRITPTHLPLAATLKCLKRLGAGSNPLLRGVSLGAPLRSSAQ